MSQNIKTFICECTIAQSQYTLHILSVSHRQTGSECVRRDEWFTGMTSDLHGSRPVTRQEAHNFLIGETETVPTSAVSYCRKEPDKTTESRATSETRQRAREGSYRGNVMFVMCFLFVLTFLGRRQRVSWRDWAQSCPDSVKQTEQN